MVLGDIVPPLTQLLKRFGPTLEILRVRCVDCAGEILKPMYTQVQFPILHHLVYREADWVPLWSQMPNLNSISLKPAKGLEFRLATGEAVRPGTISDVKLIGQHC